MRWRVCPEYAYPNMTQYVLPIWIIIEEDATGLLTMLHLFRYICSLVSSSWN